MSAAVRFEEEDLALFSEASGDRNPLHLSASYASRTAYGQQVVFGALGALACLGVSGLGRICDAPGKRIVRITADFHRPIFCGVDYSIQVSLQSEHAASARLLDGSAPLLTLNVTYSANESATGSGRYVPGSHGHFERTEAADSHIEQIGIGMARSGRYRADPTRMAALLGRWGVRSGGLPAEMLLWGSYLIGMELPGRSALFFRLAMDLGEPAGSSGEFEYEAAVSRVNLPIAQLKLSVSLRLEGRQFATGQLVSFVRPQLNLGVTKYRQRSNELVGKVALIIGASRGLGAALTGALARRGARVMAASRSFSEAGPAAADFEGQIEFAAGDAGDRKWLDSLHALMKEKYGRLDLLVCSAFPAIPLLRLEPSAVSRIEGYLNQSVNLVLGPLCTFLEMLDHSRGCIVVISSSAVEKPVREWPHYVAAKNAIEGFARVAPMQYPGTGALIVRPQRLLTEMTNTPMGRQNALPPEEIAEQIAKRVEDAPSDGRVEVMEWSNAEAENPV